MFYFYAFYKFVCTYHVVWGYLFIILFTILVRCNGKHIFLSAEKKIKTWRTGTSQEEVGHLMVKWDSFTYHFTCIDIYTIIIQYIKKWYSYVEKWDTHGEKWDVMS